MAAGGTAARRRPDFGGLIATARRVTGSDAVAILVNNAHSGPRISAQEGLLPREETELLRTAEMADSSFFAANFEAVLSAPLVYGDRSLGRVHALRRSGRSFDNADLIDDFARQAALAVVLADHPAGIDAMAEKWSSLDQLVLSAHSLGELGRALTAVVGPLFGAARLGVMIADRQRSMLQVIPGSFGAGDQEMAARPLSFYDPRSLSARVFSAQLPFLDNHFESGSRTRSHLLVDLTLHRILTVPLSEVGVLHVVNGARPFDLDDVARALGLASRIGSLVGLASALFRLRRERKLEESLSHLALALASGESIHDFLPPALQRVCEATDAYVVAFVPARGRPIVARAGESTHDLERELIGEARTDPGMRAYVIGHEDDADTGRAVLHVPVQLGGVRVGTLSALRVRDEPFAHAERGYFARIANIAALNHATESYQQQRAELARLQERQRIADDLHDDVAQILFAAQLSLDTVLAHQAVDEEVASSVARARALLIRGDTAIRSVIHRLAKPPAGDIASRVAAAVTGVEEEFGLAVHLVVDEAAALAARRLRRAAADALVKVAREALVNAAKHAGPCRVSVRLELVRDRVVLSVADSGLGASSLTHGGRHGVASLRRVIREQGGTLRLTHPVAGGTRVAVAFPVSTTAGAQRLHRTAPV